MATLLLCLALLLPTAQPYPSQPLNQRPDAWQAWLLLDAQSEHSGTDTERRITPKSVFIAPKFGSSNATLPDCADGYRSDPMGHCIKFVKVDEAAHLDFLLQRLNAMYATTVEEDSVDDGGDVQSTSGPLLVNIPLRGNSDVANFLETSTPRTFQNDDAMDSTTETSTVITTTGDYAALFFLAPENSEQTTKDEWTSEEEEEQEEETTTVSTSLPTTATIPQLDHNSGASTESIAFNTQPQMSSTKIKGNSNLETSHSESTAHAHTGIVFPTDPPLEPSKPQHDALLALSTSEDLSNSGLFPKDSVPVANPELTAHAHKRIAFPTDTPPAAAAPQLLNSDQIAELFPADAPSVHETAEFIPTDAVSQHKIAGLFPTDVPPQHELTELFQEFIHRKQLEAYHQAQIPRPQRVYNHRNRDRNSEFWRNHEQPGFRFNKSPTIRFSEEDPQQYFDAQRTGALAFARTRRRGAFR